MKTIAKINLFILLIALYQTAYCAEYHTPQSSSPAEEMLLDVLSQPIPPVEEIFSPFSLQHPDHIEKTTSQESVEHFVFVQDNSTQTKATNIREEIESLIHFHCDPANTNLFITGEINGIHYEFSTLNNQRNVEFKKEIQQGQKPVKPFIKKLLQKQNNQSNQRRSDSFEDLEISTDSTLIDACSSRDSRERRKPSKFITYNPNVNTTEKAKNNPTYFTTKNCLIGSLTVATVMTGYLMLKNRK